MKRVGALLLLLTIPCWNQPTPSAEGTGGFINGRNWRGMSDIARVMYVRGLSDGLASFCQARVATAIPHPPFTFGEMVDSLNLFYGDPTNVSIPVSMALMVVQLKVSGVPPQELDRFVAQLRETTSNATPSATK